MAAYACNACASMRTILSCWASPKPIHSGRRISLAEMELVTASPPCTFPYFSPQGDEWRGT